MKQLLQKLFNKPVIETIYIPDDVLADLINEPLE